MNGTPENAGALSARIMRFAHEIKRNDNYGPTGSTVKLIDQNGDVICKVSARDFCTAASAALDIAEVAK